MAPIITRVQAGMAVVVAVAVGAMALATPAVAESADVPDPAGENRSVSDPGEDEAGAIAEYLAADDHEHDSGDHVETQQADGESIGFSAAYEAAAPKGLGPGSATGGRTDGYLPQNSCDPVTKPGVADFRSKVLARYGSALGDWGIVRECTAGGTSEHKEGRAWDMRADVRYANQKAAATDLLAWLTAKGPDGQSGYYARSLGIMYMIWDQKIWSSYRADDGWRPMSDRGSWTANHKDHVHFSFTWNGAWKRTSWWTGKIPATDFGPCRPYSGQPAPIADRRSPTLSSCPSPRGLPSGWSSTVYWYGHQGSAVSQIQRQLNEFGISVPVTGNFLSQTWSAVRTFQDRNGLPDTGAWDAATRAALSQNMEPPEAQLWQTSKDRYTDPGGQILKVNLDPNLGSQAWQIVLQQQDNGSWTDVVTTKTRGRSEIAWLDVPAGTYRIQVPAQRSRPSATSNTVQHTKPAAAGDISSKGNTVSVNVGPNLTSDHAYQVTLQYRKGGSWHDVRTGTTSGTAEIARFRNVERGTYRVAISGARGFDGSTTARIDHTPPIPDVVLSARSNRDRTDGGGRILHVNLGPNLDRAWVGELQRLDDGSWRTIRRLETYGRNSVAHLDVNSGTYRVVLPAQHGHDSVTTPAFDFARPQASVRVASKGSRIVANVDPNLSGSRYYVVRLEKQVDGRWKKVASARTRYTAEKVNFGTRLPGEFRVRVWARWGYDPATSSTLSHVG